ncbi:MAG: class I SAM-dependent methyltransferase [Gammaproteobacteria bacterium]|nr:class I SAM-dependent methyltransferase [Gammaproteobacteria bacterium]MYF03278.1 class I SAM-dependent methyltransferase [Gammaproteobacteria bacterium]
MLGLRRNFGTVLEPAGGKGVFLRLLEKNAVAIEFDESLNTDPRLIVVDYFDYPTRHKFDTIVGNPPYVRFQDIIPRTKEKLPMELFDCRSNLYLFFIAKSIKHLEPNGELIFITPREFLKATSAKKLNEVLFREGTMTHYFELGDTSVFDDVTPNCAIWRWEKNNFDRLMETGGKFQCVNGQIYFGESARTTVNDFFDVKVGAVSGADDVFADRRFGCTDMVCSTTVREGNLRRMIYDRYHKALEPHKDRLLNRKIRRFNERNWWEWGRKYCSRQGVRIYVNSKTRNKKPFYISEIEAYDGSVLALFPKLGVDLDRAVQKLNATDWEKLAFVCDGRLLFSQRSLANAPFEM